MFKKILIANRGEIAVRVMRTAKEMGIAVVAIYSDADEASLHVTTADEAVALGNPDPTSSYLNIDKIIAAAKQTGAEAIHPGYGFLAENAIFAKRVVEEGLIFIGPPSEALAAVGDKTMARQIMSKHNVPLIPGMVESQADPAALAKAAEDIGYPVLIKAAGGGGGKGMRVVESADLLAEAAQSASSEALSSFGDGSIYLEKYIERPRHVEFQIFADSFGHAVHLFERECSVQRRHQKIIEETPSPALDDDLRRRMGEAAVAAAKASGYVNAGTVEFLLDQSGNFYFLEVNARLQVEHPVTELCVGLDLVRLQLEISAGRALPFTQEDLKARGHAIECRIYAEDPDQNFMPAPGRILFTRFPEGPNVRFDHGIYAGFDVPVHYDPILGKLIVWAEDRQSAINRMIRALKECVILGVKTPIEFMIEALSTKEFQSGDTHTHFIEEHFKDWKSGMDGDSLAALGFVLNEMIGRKAQPAGQEVGGPSEPPTPWQTLGAWDL